MIVVYGKCALTRATLWAAVCLEGLNWKEVGVEWAEGASEENLMIHPGDIP